MLSYLTYFYILNYVEFTQGKLRIARDTTVNDYLCCNGVLNIYYIVKSLGPSSTQTQFVDK